MKKLLFFIDLLLLLLIFSPKILKKLGLEDAEIFKWIPKQAAETDILSFGDSEDQKIENEDHVVMTESAGNGEDPFAALIPPGDEEETLLQEAPVLPDGSDRPEDADFIDWYVGDVFQNGVPENAEKITDFGSVTGSWKAMLYLDPGNENGRESIRLFNVFIDAGQEAPEMTVSWYAVYWFEDDASYSEEDCPGILLTGAWSDGRFSLTGDAEVDITDFYRQNGKEYAVGSWNDDGTEGYLALVRP